MFTGLVQKTGSVVAVDRTPDGHGRLVLESTPWDPPLATGESVAVHGVCLTASPRNPGRVAFDLLRETFERTNLGDKKAGDSLNLERALRYGDPLGGHLVNGHVDGVGEVVGLRRVDSRDWEVLIGCAEDLLQDIVPKGSVACEGVSLTVVDVAGTSFAVHIIPHTWSCTSFHQLQPGHRVNLEVDILSKYVRKALQRGQPPEPLSWEALRRAGLLREED